MDDCCAKEASEGQWYSSAGNLEFSLTFYIAANHKDWIFDKNCVVLISWCPKRHRKTHGA